MSNYKYENLTENMRADFLGQTSILDEIRRVIFLPGYNGMTTDMVAAYFEVNPASVVNMLRSHQSDFIADGVYYVKKDDLYNSLVENNVLIESYRGRNVINIDGNVMEISITAQYIFTRRAMMRLALLLKHSFTAEQIKRKLIDDYDDFNDKGSIFLGSREMRDNYSGCISILDKVKPTHYIPQLGVMTHQMAAEYFDVSPNELIGIYYKHFSELRDSGVYEKSMNEVAYLFSQNGITPIETNDGTISIILNNRLIKISDEKNIFYPATAILRIGMLLSSNSVARKIRRSLIEVLPDIKEKDSFVVKNTVNSLKAAESSDTAEYTKAIDFAINKTIDERKQLVENLRKENDSLYNQIAQFNGNETQESLLVSEVRRIAKELIVSIVKGL